jgi:hypothetical protein
MKTIIKLAILIMGFNSHAQSPVLPLFNNPDFGAIDDAYYKDLDNSFSQFLGTWEYVNGTTSLKIVFYKSTQYFNDFSSHYEDVVYGNYRYVENGVEMVNTLSNTDADPYGHAIVGNLIFQNSNVPICSECTLNQKRLNLMFNDPTRNEVEGLAGEIIVKRADVGNVQKITISLTQTGNIIFIEGNPPQYTSLSVPWGTYTLTKVN